MTVGQLKERLAEISSDKDDLPIHIMHEVKMYDSVVQFEDEVKDVGVSSSYVVIIGTELLGEK